MQKFLIPLLLLTLAGCQQNNQRYNGYVDADLTYLSSDYSGRIATLNVSRGNPVTAGELLFKLEQDSESRNIAISRTQQENLQSQQKELSVRLSYARLNYQRMLQLQTQGAASNDDLDQARQNLKVLENQSSALYAQLSGNNLDTDQKIWQLQHKQNSAAESGIIFDTYFNPHEYVTAGTPILSLITATNIKIIFYVPEPQLGKLRLGEAIIYTNDGNSHTESGVISYISAKAEYTPPIIFSSEDRHKLVFRVEARLNNPDLTTIHLGQPVTLELQP